MQETFVTQSTEVNLKDIDLTGKTQNQLAELARSALGESLNLARRSVESAWCAGRFLERAKQNTKHGQWGAWVEDHGFSPDIVERVRKLYQLAPEIPQIAEFESVDQALRELKPAPKPKPVSNELAKAAAMPIVDPTGAKAKANQVEAERVQDKTGNPVMAVDITTGEVKEWNPTDKQPTPEEQLRAHEGAPTETQDLTARDLKKSGGVPTEPRKTMRRNMRYNAEENGIEVLESLTLTDYVVISARDLFRMKNGYPVQGVGAEQVVYQKGEVIR